jgi:hypothetical protein
VELYQVPSSTTATVTVTFANRNGSSVKVRLAHAASGDSSATNDDYLAYDLSVGANATTQFTGIVMANQEKLFAESDTASVTVTAHGFEE